MARHTKGNKASGKRPGKRPGADAQKSSPDLVAKSKPKPAHSTHSIEATLTVAEQRYDQGNNEAVLKTLAPLEAQYPFGDKLHCGRYNRLLAFAYAHLKKFADAEQVIRRGLELFPGALDYHYTDCFVKLSLREFDQTLRAAQTYLVQREKSPAHELSLLDSTYNQLTHILNFMGAAYQDLQQLDRAQHAFEQAIEADTGNYLPYLNLANLHARGRDWDRVTQTITQGLKQCRRINELRMLAETYTKRSTVSACIMVKNEEEMLPGCLDSLRDWVDEIVVVDTGSTDKTVDIARSYGAKIYHHPWENSFSGARNHTLEHATSDWIFVIDADERVFAEDVPQVTQMLNQERFPVIAVNVFNYYPEIEDTVTFLPSKRLFRRSLGLQYAGIVHNQLLVPEGTPTLKTGIRIKHFGYGLSKERMEAKLARTKALLEQQLQETPDDAFALFNYAQLHRASPDGFKIENARIVLQAAGKAVQITSPDNPDTRHIYYMCLDQLAWTHYFMKEYDTAARYCLQALATKPNYLDSLLLLGYVYYSTNAFEESRQYFEKYIAAHAVYNPAEETENIILLNLGGRADALFNLGVLAEMRQDWRVAKEYFAETLRANPVYHSANFALAKACVRENDLATAERHFVEQLKIGRHKLETLLSLAQLAMQQEKFVKAEEFCQRAISDFPTSIPALLEYAQLCRKAGRFAQAADYFRQAIAAGSSDPSVKVLFAESCSSAGSVSEAISIYESLLVEHPESSGYANDLGNCHYRQGDFAAAEKYYLDSLRVGPGQMETLRNLGLAQARLQKNGEAIASLREYLRKRPEDTDIQHVIGDLYLASQAPDQALGHFEQYLRQNPLDSRAFFRLAECYLLMGHRDSALLGYQKTLQLDPLFGPAQERLEMLLHTPAGV